MFLGVLEVKKKFGNIKTVFVLVMCIAALVLSSCGKGSDGPDTGSVTQAPTEAEPTGVEPGQTDTPTPTGEEPTKRPDFHRQVSYGKERKLTCTRAE